MALEKASIPMFGPPSAFSIQPHGRSILLGFGFPFQGSEERVLLATAPQPASANRFIDNGVRPNGPGERIMGFRKTKSPMWTVRSISVSFMISPTSGHPRWRYLSRSSIQVNFLDLGPTVSYLNGHFVRIVGNRTPEGQLFQKILSKKSNYCISAKCTSCKISYLNTSKSCL